jgi:hypothetical protein
MTNYWKTKDCIGQIDLHGSFTAAVESAASAHQRHGTTVEILGLSDGYIGAVRHDDHEGTAVLDVTPEYRVQLASELASIKARRIIRVD